MIRREASSEEKTNTRLLLTHFFFFLLISANRASFLEPGSLGDIYIYIYIRGALWSWSENGRKSGRGESEEGIERICLVILCSLLG